MLTGLYSIFILLYVGHSVVTYKRQWRNKSSQSQLCIFYCILHVSAFLKPPLLGNIEYERNVIFSEVFYIPDDGILKRPKHVAI
jgi:hypothetical protein